MKTDSCIQKNAFYFHFQKGPMELILLIFNIYENKNKIFT